MDESLTGHEHSPKDPHFDRKMEIARQCMKEHRETLAELAEEAYQEGAS